MLQICRPTAESASQLAVNSGSETEGAEANEARGVGRRRFQQLCHARGGPAPRRAAPWPTLSPLLPSLARRPAWKSGLGAIQLPAILIHEMPIP